MTVPHIWGVKIIGIGIDDLGPESILSNDELAKRLLKQRDIDAERLGIAAFSEEEASRYETDDAWIQNRIHIRERRIAPREFATSDLAIQAGKNAMRHAGVTPEQIGSLRLGTVTPDEWATPPTVSRVACGLGIPVWDVENELLHELIACDHMYACSTFLAALQDGVSDLMLGRCEYALIIGADKMSSITDWSTRDFCPILADGAGAFVLKRVPYEESDFTVNGFYAGGDTSKTEKIITPVGGSRRPLTAEEFEADPLLRNTKIHMDGNRVFKDLVSMLRRHIVPQALEKMGHTPSSIDIIFPHQANGRMSDEGLETPLRKLGFTGIISKTIEKYGNTTSATVPLGMFDAYKNGTLLPGRTVLIVVMGGGYSWRACTLIWSRA